MERKISVTHINVRQSIFFLLLKLLIIDLMAAFMVWLFFSSFGIASLSDQMKLEFIARSRTYFIILIIVKIYLTLFVVIQWVNEYYEISHDMVTHRRGFIWKKEDQYPLRHIRMVRIEQGIIGRIFGYGTIELLDWDLAKYTTLYLVHNPMKYFYILEGLLPRATSEKHVLTEKIIEEDKR